MQVVFKIALMAAIGGLIGYITNVIAVKMLFRPYEPLKIPLTKFEIVGLIPKRRKEIAKSIAETVKKEILSEDDIFDNLVTEDDKKKIVEYIIKKIKDIIDEKAKSIPFPFVGMISSVVEDIVKKEAEGMIDDLIDDFIKTAKERVDVEKLIEDKINSFDIEEVEELIIRIAKKELKHIEILGLILGSVIGLVQGFISILL